MTHLARAKDLTGEDRVALRAIIDEADESEGGPTSQGQESVAIIRDPVRRKRGRLIRVAAAQRIAALFAIRRPGRDDEQVRGQAPARIGLEHMVLQHEVPGIRPVVGNVVPIVVAQHVGRLVPGR